MEQSKGKKSKKALKVIGIILTVLIVLFGTLTVVSHAVYHRSNMATLSELYLRISGTKAKFEDAKKKGKESGDYLLCDNHDNSVFEEKKHIERWISNHKHKFQDPDRASKVEPGKKPRATERLGFHSLRHTYTQKSMKTMREQGLPDKKVRKEASESLGHHRTSITKIYEE